MKGTRNPHTLAMPLIPKKMTAATMTVRMLPDTYCEILNVSLSIVDMEFDCTEQPIPRAAMMVKTQNRTASHFMPRPRSRAYMGPPSMVPSDVFTRYLTASNPSEYLVAIPKTPLNQHHRTAPGPPSETAVATPMMLPVPMVAARAVARAPNWLTSPFESPSLLTDRAIPLKIFRWGNFRRMVKKTWVPSRMIIMGQPHNKPLSLLKKSCISCIVHYLW